MGLMSPGLEDDVCGGWWPRSRSPVLKGEQAARKAKQQTVMRILFMICLFIFIRALKDKVTGRYSPCNFSLSKKYAVTEK
jgi:hypothetical protein